MKWTSLWSALALTVLSGSLAGTATAGSVDLASAPLVSAVTKVVPPNIQFILDDSTSMSWDYMPDDVNNDNSSRCFKNWGYNKIAYNPNITYTAPLKADGTSYPASTFTAAKIDGYGVTSTSTTDLSATNSVSQNAGNNPITTSNGSKTVTVGLNGHGYVVGQSITIAGVNGGGTVRGVSGLNNTFTIVSVPNKNSFTITGGSNATSNGTGGGNGVTVSVANPVWVYADYTSSPTTPSSSCAADSAYTLKAPSTAAEKQNFANWYSYYRTRINMMKSASGRAFATVTDKYRVGFDVISNKSTNSVKVKVKKFSSSQKSDWYTALYAASPFAGSSGTQYTPLRGALSKAGRMYAGKVITGNEDPVQYSCQQNFTILTTDGYWNKTDEVTSGSSRYGPYQMDNTTSVGDQDGVTGTPRPMLDGGKYSDTLADVAMYYYKTDLRPTSGLGGLLDNGVDRVDVSANDVPVVSGKDNAKWQHMVTFGLGLGVAGTLGYSENYLNNGSADFNAINQGSKNWPDPQVSSSSNQVLERIDDLWHAAVNGRGQYLSAANPDAVVTALQKALATISAQNGSAAAAATSSLEPVAGQDFAYVAQYTTAQWYGDLIARQIDVTDGSLSATPAWSARDKLGAKVGASTDTRVIKLFDSTAASKLKDFTSANLTAEKTAGYFSSSSLSQYGSWIAAQKTAATDDAMIEYLRGRYAYENEPANADSNKKLYRDREYTLGDIVDTQPVYVGKPPFNYSDADYATFASSKSTRTPMVYVGANDGMLHAFDATKTGGTEEWAFIPSAVVPKLRRLADSNYSTNHEFYVDGPITVGDAYNGSAWKTILIGGLGGGGRAYYALDVTDPASPKGLWEFNTTSDADLGYTYGNPILTKRDSDGKWVVIFASGYNNAAPGDSKGRLYVVDAFTGAKLQEIVTDNGVTDPNVSGIAKVNNYVPDTLLDNTTQYVYGGDLGGSLWRFDITAGTSQRLGKTSATAGNQPITVKPELARVRDAAGNYHRVVYFGTGRYLGLSDRDPSSTSESVVQAIYGISDTGADLGVFTDADAKLVKQTLDTSVNPRKIANPVAVDWTQKNGWYLETPKGERFNVDPRLQLGTLAILSNLTGEDYCKNGSAWLYALDYKTGSYVTSSASKVVGYEVSGSNATGLTLIRLPTNKLIAIVTQSDTTVKPMDVPVAPTGGVSVRRVGWREIN